MEDKGTHRLQDTAFAITRWVGSPQSIVAHTIVFFGSFAAVILHLVSFDRMLLVLTTVVSLEAIYLSIFIQMSLNVTSANLAEVEQDIDEIQEDVGEIQEDIDEMQEDVEEIQEDIDEVQEDVEELQEDVEEMNEEESSEEADYQKEQRTLEQIHEGLQKLMQDVERLQNKVI